MTCVRHPRHPIPWQGRPTQDASDLIQALFYRASLDACVTAGTPTGSTLAVGEARLRFADCKNATLDHRIAAGHPADGAVGRLPGLSLIRLLSSGKRTTGRGMQAAPAGSIERESARLAAC
jgi:hypothetical protein